MEMLLELFISFLYSLSQALRLNNNKSVKYLKHTVYFSCSLTAGFFSIQAPQWRLSCDTMATELIIKPNVDLAATDAASSSFSDCRPHYA